MNNIYPNFKMRKELAHKEIMSHRLSDTLKYNQRVNRYFWESDGRPLDSELFHADTIYPNKHLFDIVPSVKSLVVIQQDIIVNEIYDRGRLVLVNLVNSDLLQKYLEILKFTRHGSRYAPYKMFEDDLFYNDECNIYDIRDEPNDQVIVIEKSKLFTDYTTVGTIHSFFARDGWVTTGVVYLHDDTNKLKLVDYEELLLETSKISYDMAIEKAIMINSFLEDNSSEEYVNYIKSIVKDYIE